MSFNIGDRVQHPDDGRYGTIIEIDDNPACMMRVMIVRWDDGNIEEHEELEFGPLSD